MRRRFTGGSLRLARSRWTVRAVAGLTGTVLFFTAACSGKGAEKVTIQGKDDPAAPAVSISPGDGSGKARPEKGVVVKAAGGTLETVTLTAKGKQVTGAMSADRTSWKSRTLTPGTAFQVSATAKSPEGKTTTATSKFRTLKAVNTLSILSMSPTPGTKVGVGMPITITFNRQVTDRRAVERALVVRSQKAATGAWFWVNNQTVIFRTKNNSYWKPNQTISFAARLAGVKAAKDTYGTADISRRFTIGDSHIITVNAKTHRLTVKKNGEVIKTWGISAGKGGLVRNGVDVYQTTSGVHLTMSKHRVERMTSAWMGVDPKDKKNGGYDEKIPFAVRISNSGEYIHSMASTVWAQGRQNVSHGCINSPPASAEWFYNWSYLGDVVIVTGTERGLDWNNGWSYYQMPWKQWVQGSAFDRSVSTAVTKPSTSPTPATSVIPSAPLGTGPSTAPPVAAN
ncbi:MAG: Ig-like domain-containing protein [Actinomadura sp.]